MAGLRALAWVTHALAWELRRLLRVFRLRFGAPGLSAAALLLVAGMAMCIEHGAHAERESLQRELAAQHGSQPLPGLVGEVPVDQGRTRLAEFDRYLPPHEEIPQAVGDLLTLAEREGLV